jgi:uncharacterized Zn finger protein
MPACSTEGPVCPWCSALWTTDEAFYFDENGYELECDECGAVFAVEPCASWSWTSHLIVKKRKP